MSTTVTTVISAAFATHSYDALSTSVGVVAIVLLLVVLLERELLRASGGRRAMDGVRILNLAAVPLLLPFALIVVVRLLSIIAGHPA